MLVDMFEPSVPLADTEGGRVVYLVVGNIRGGVDVFSGDVQFDYFPPITPPGGESEHVYTFLVYEQPDGRLQFNEPQTPTCTYASRAHFDPGAFQTKYHLDGPKFGNLFRVEPLTDFSSIFRLFAPCA